mgnify:CR=1 FL=1
MARALFAAGFRAGDLVHNSFSYHLTPAGSMMETGAHAIGCTVLPAGTGQTELQLQAMVALAPDAYAGTPSFLRLLLEKADETGIALPSLKKAALSGEAVPLEDQDRGLWDAGEIAEGLALSERAAAHGPVGPYTIQARIAAVWRRGDRSPALLQALALLKEEMARR